MANLYFNKLKKTDAIWLPQIPEHWELVKVRHLFKESTKKGFPNETLLVASQKHGVVSKDAYGKRTVEATKDLHNLKLVEIGDYVISLRSFQGGIELAYERGIISPAYTIMKETKLIDKRYFKNLFKSPPFISLMTLCVKGIREGQNIDYPTFKNEYLPFPPIEEQKAIAEYLDKKNNEIDKFIRNKERLIKLLEEDKQSVIRKAVTKGLNSNINFKETGIDWIGEIPENWKIKKLKYCTRIIYGISPHENTYNDNGIGSVLVNGPVEYSGEIFGYTRELKWTTDPKKFAPKNALLFCLRGSTTGRLNICHNDVSIGRGVAAIISKTNQDFMVFAIKALVGFISDSFKGSTFPSVTSEDLNNYLIPLPAATEEEIEIVNFLNEETKIFDVAISKAQQEITSIKEYREALITDLVTGKRSIPQIQSS